MDDEDDYQRSRRRQREWRRRNPVYGPRPPPRKKYHKAYNRTKFIPGEPELRGFTPQQTRRWNMARRQYDKTRGKRVWEILQHMPVRQERILNNYLKSISQRLLNEDKEPNMVREWRKSHRYRFKKDRRKYKMYKRVKKLKANRRTLNDISQRLNNAIAVSKTRLYLPPPRHSPRYYKGIQSRYTMALHPEYKVLRKKGGGKRRRRTRRRRRS